MSSTSRGAERNRADYYPTPAWCVRRLLEAVPLPSGLWLEPGAGAGHIIRAAQPLRPELQWAAVELREECRDTLAATGAEVWITDFLREFPVGRRYRVALGNPPYSLALQFIEQAMRCADTVALLLRLNFLGTQDRADFHAAFPADVYVLPDRPSFTGKGTDSIEYAWFVWGGPEGGGRWRVLAKTPLDEKKADARALHR